MFVFRKISRPLFSCNTRFEIHPFALLPAKCNKICFYVNKFTDGFLRV